MLRFSVQHCTVINPCAVLNKKIINTSWKRTRGNCWLVKPLSEVSYWKKMMATWVNCYIMHLILTILNLMTEHKYTKVYTKACILNNSVYAVIKARTHIYIWSLRMKSHVSTFCEHDPCSEMIAKGSFALCHFSQIHCKE